jgi:hypothetical protein
VLAEIYLQGFAIRGNGFFELRHPALLFGKRCKSKAEIHLGRGPFLWPEFVGPFLQGVAMGRNCLLDPCWVFLLITERFRARPRFALVVAQ